jgi:hypothetical protein
MNQSSAIGQEKVKTIHGSRAFAFLGLVCLTIAAVCSLISSAWTALVECF